MLIYWDRKRTVDPRREFEQLRGADAIDILIGLAQLEAGVADAAWPERDGADNLSRELRCLMTQVARAWLAGAAVTPGPTPLNLPAQVELSVPEGYAYYGLYPETYAEAAMRFAAEARPDSVGVIGIRNIGTSLSAVVAAALERSGCQVSSWTVRPRGHPFARTLVLTPDLERAWASNATCWWAVVDEGPGLSGSSMTCAAQKLSEIGVPDDRIVLFPSWEPSGDEFVSDDARRRWKRHRKYTGQFKPPDGLLDISAGEWRRLAYPNSDDWPAVQPHHERRKFLENGRILWKFAGLGRFGRARFERAERLWRAGFGPRPLGLENGFLRMEWLAGHPVRKAGTALIETIVRYLTFMRDEFPGGEGASPNQLLEMIRVNTGREWEGGVPDCVPCGIDGRMLPHEWIQTPRGFVKTDALDHHDNHFLPGCQAIGWDVAGAAVEFGLDTASARRIAKSCGADATLTFFLRAYSAFRAGYASLARTAIAGTPDAERFASLESRYRAV